MILALYSTLFIMVISIGTAIYIGVKPLIKVFLTGSIGFYLARKKVLTPQVCQAISLIIVNVLTPCLIFNKILVSLDSSDIVAIGVMVLTSALYVALGLTCTLIVKALTPNPKYWLGGLLTAGMFSNNGDLPIAYMTTLSSGSAFTATQSARGVAYCTIFMALLSFYLYSLGAWHLIARDFQIMKIDKEKGTLNITCEPGIKSLLGKRRHRHHAEVDDSLHSVSSNTSIPAILEEPEQFSKIDSRQLESSITELEPIVPVLSTKSDIPQLVIPPPPSRIELFFIKHHIRFLWEVIKNLARPPSLSLIVAMFCTMIPPIRKLFYVGSDGLQSLGAANIPDAPDGAPILGFVMDFTSFVAASLVPFGIMMLGATAGDLKIKYIPPGFWRAVLLSCMFKLVVIPIVAIAWTKKMTTLGWIDPSNSMAQLVMILNSGLPSPTMLIYLTAIFRPKESSHQMDCAAIFIIAQYAILVVSMTILLTYTLTSVIKLEF